MEVPEWRDGTETVVFVSLLASQYSDEFGQRSLTATNSVFANVSIYAIFAAV